MYSHLFVYLVKSGIFKLTNQYFNIFGRLRAEKVVVGYIELLIVELALFGKKCVDSLTAITRALIPT